MELEELREKVDNTNESMQKYMNLIEEGKLYEVNQLVASDEFERFMKDANDILQDMKKSAEEGDEFAEFLAGIYETALEQMDETIKLAKEACEKFEEMNLSPEELNSEFLKLREIAAETAPFN